MILGIDKSIFRRLLFSYLFTVLLGLCAVGLLMSYFAKAYIVDSVKTELLRKAKRVNLSIQQETRVNDGVRKMLVFFDQSYDTRIWLFDRTGNIVATSTQDEVTIGKAVNASIVSKVMKGENAVNDLSFEGMTQPMLSVVVPWGKDDNVYGGIILHAPINGIEETVSNLRETILWVTLFGIILSTAIASYLSWSISRPLRKIDQAAARISMGDYAKRIRISSKDEIGDLASTINTMADKLEQIDSDRRKLEQIRHDFLANISHELRTPLTAMQGFLEALQDDLIDEESRQKYYGIIYHETLHMNRLVDDIMDLIKLENNDIVLAKAPIDIASMLRKAAFRFSQEAAEKGLEIKVETAPDLPNADADPTRFEQILNNLVKNAVKFTENGIISLRAKQDGDYVQISVSDTGIGISPGDQEMIWERFFKVDRGRSKKNAGNGLGLAIVRELVELHDGKIDVASEPGKGTTFDVWIPVRPAV
jgi:signal transduction histidine kinase